MICLSKSIYETHCIPGRSCGAVLDNTFIVIAFVIGVTKQDLKVEQNLFMDSGDIGCAR